jgi:hypothetical protein
MTVTPTELEGRGADYGATEVQWTALAADDDGAWVRMRPGRLVAEVAGTFDGATVDIELSPVAMNAMHSGHLAPTGGEAVASGIDEAGVYQAAPVRAEYWVRPITTGGTSPDLTVTLRAIERMGA